MVGPKHNGVRSELLSKLWDTMTPSNSHYDHFELYGRFHTAPIAEYADPTMYAGECFTRVDKDLQDEIKKLSGDFCYAKTTRKHLDISVRKMDKKPVYTYKQDKYYPLALDIVKEQFEKALSQPHMSPDEVLADLDLTKAPGFFETWRGFKTKYDCVLAGVLSEYNDQDLNEIPIWKVSGKNEIKETSAYVNEYKQRTFIIEPFNMLWHDKRIFGGQNKGMKEVWWSAYGFNPYDGGTGNLWRSLSSFKRFWEWDVRGYDRVMPHLKDIGKIRGAFAVPDKFLDWVLKHKCKSILVLPNGDVIYKYWGNNSGSGTTTTDNIIGMCIIVVHGFLRAGCSKNDILNKVNCLIFGDDVLGGDNLSFSDNFMEELFRSTFAMYGYELDPLKITHSLEGMSFLGFELAKVENYILPKYKLPRIAFSFMHTVSDKEDIDVEISKMLSLMLMSVGHGPAVYNLFRDALLQVVVRSTSVYAKRLQINGVHDNIPSYEDALSWCIGMEGVEKYRSDLFWSEVVQINFVST